MAYAHTHTEETWHRRSGRATLAGSAGQHLLDSKFTYKQQKEYNNVY